MSNTEADSIDAAVEELARTTKALQEPISDLTVKIDELSGQMEQVADEMSKFDKSGNQLAQARVSESGVGHRQAVADD